MNRELLRQAPGVRSLLALTVSVGVLAAVVTIAQMTLLSKIVAGVFLAHQTLARVEPLLLTLLGAFVVRAALIWTQEVAAQRGAIRVKAALRERLFAHLLRLGPVYARGERTGELVASAVEGVDRLDAYVGRYLPQTALSVLVPLLIAAYILPLDWASGVLLLVTGPIIPLLMILVGSYTKEHVDKQWAALSRLGAHFLDAVQGLPTLIVFGRGADERGRIAAVGEEFKDKTLKALRLAFLSGLVLELLSAFAIALVAVTLGVRLLDGGISFEAAFLVLLLAPEFYRPLRELGVHRHAGMEGSAAATRIFEILRTPVQQQEGTMTAQRPSGQLTVTLENVSYTYPAVRGPSGSAGVSPRAPLRTGPPGLRTWRPSRVPAFARHTETIRQERHSIEIEGQASRPAGMAGSTDAGWKPAVPGGRPAVVRGDLVQALDANPGASARPALSNVSLMLPAGTRTAIVGRSGAGKSTLVNLLLRFIDPREGRIVVNGIPINELPIEVWRAQVALVPQRPYLFYGSVRDNIRLARPDAPPADVAWAARLAGAEDFIARLPQGYDTAIGERGVRLSAGQAQRIAIARAFLKDAPILILDEPTSSLDPESETVVREALERLMHDRTVLIVAHRLNTVYSAGQIAVLDEGRLVETGRHDDLLGHGGPYARLIGAYGKVPMPAPSVSGEARVSRCGEAPASVSGETSL